MPTQVLALWGRFLSDLSKNEWEWHTEYAASCHLHDLHDIVESFKNLLHNVILELL